MPWDSTPLREEIFSVERIEQHARRLAAAQPARPKKPITISAKFHFPRETWQLPSEPNLSQPSAKVTLGSRISAAVRAR